MTYIFVNLKRFDVPKSLGGICLNDNPQEWIEWVVDQSVQFGLGQLDSSANLELTNSNSPKTQPQRSSKRSRCFMNYSSPL